MAILPLIDQKALYNRFHLDEPWDSPHNKALLKEMPALYAPVVNKGQAPFTTHYQVIVGPGWTQPCSARASGAGPMFALCAIAAAE